MSYTACLPPTIPPRALKKNLPAPFAEEPTGGGGIRMHHKFVVVDFDKPSARVYLGSYNFSVPADTRNGENLLVIRDRPVHSFHSRSFQMTESSITVSPAARRNAFHSAAR